MEKLLSIRNDIFESNKVQVTSEGNSHGE